MVCDATREKKKPQTNGIGQWTPTGRYRPSSHQEDCCLPYGTHTTNDRHQTPTVPSPTSCYQIEVAEELHAHSQPARLVCKQQQTAALERQPGRRAILRKNGTGGGRVFAGWIWRGLAQTAHRRGLFENSDEEMGLSRRRPVGRLRLRGDQQTMAHILSCRLLDEACTADDLATVTERAKSCARKWEKMV